MRLDDAQVERYSRQIVLPEVGPEGQLRLLGAAVGVVGAGPAAERVVAYLAAAGVGRVAAAPVLHGCADRGQQDVTIVGGPTPSDAVKLDAVVLCERAAHDPRPWTAARSVLWVADGGAAMIPPCAGCAAANLRRDRGAPPKALVAIRDAMLGTMIATEVVKALLGIGASPRGRVVLYDPTRALVETRPVACDARCATCGALAAPAR